MAYRKKLDGFGVVMLASVTAIGGGTIRDLILDAPVFWLRDSTYLISILVAAFISIVWLNKQKRFPQIALEIADSLGLAFFVVMGTQKALDYGMPDMTAVVMGTFTGCFGACCETCSRGLCLWCSKVSFMRQPVLLAVFYIRKAYH